MSDQELSSHGQGAQNLPKQIIIDDILKSEQVEIERKKIVCTLKKNRRGRFLRISEVAGCHRNTINIPAAGLRDLRRILDAMLGSEDESSSDPQP